VALHCPECGFANAVGANYCQKCGAFLAIGESSGAGHETTATYRIGETGEIEPVQLEQVVARGAALVIRSGGRSSCARRRSRSSRPRDVFLDDVTVSRDHALLVHRGDDWYLDDCGSLNGTYVNRTRIESHRLADGDELQVGKYKLAYLTR